MRSIVSLTLNYQPPWLLSPHPLLFAEKCKMTAVKSDIQADKPVFPKEKEELTAKGRRGSLCGGRPKTAQVVSPAQDCKIMEKKENVLTNYIHI